MTIEIDRDSSTPIFRQIEEHILKGIQNGDMEPGDRIPSQNKLARECQVSRATVQRALEHLIMEDVLYSQPGKGIYVASPPERQRLPVLQSFSQSFRAMGHRVRADLLLSETITVSPYVARSLALADGEDVIRVKRLQHVDDQPMMLETVYLAADRFQAVMERDLRHESLLQIVQEVGGVRIGGSSVAIEAGVANWEEARILNVQGGNPLLTVEEIDYDTDEQPIRFSRNKFRGDQFRAVASTVNGDITLEYRLRPGAVNIALL